MPDGGFELSTDLDLARSQDEVFEFLVDTENFRTVDQALVDYGPVGRLALGQKGWFKHRRGGMTARTSWTVTALESPRHVVVEARGMGYAMTETADLVQTETGTRATFVERVWPTSLLGRLLVALSGGIMRRDLRARSELLRAALER